jgi:glycosyltransferase involved in cell wall biosynthesis
VKLLFVQDAGYYTWAGGMKANRYLALALARRGHDCRAVVGIDAYRRINLDFRSDASIDVIHRSETQVRLLDHGIPVEACLSAGTFESQTVKAIDDFTPDAIVFSETDSYRRLRLIPDLSRCVIAVHCVETLPFGPSAVLPDSEATALFQSVGGTLVVSHFLEAYLHDHAGVEACVVRYPGYGRAPYPEYGRKDGLVMLINAADIKGLPILLGLADRFPDVRFGAVPSWATTPLDLFRLVRRKNVRILEPTPDIEALFGQVRILLVPSLCQESFPRVVIEAMLRRIPVMASNVGGLAEAKLGADYVLPVRPIRKWLTRSAGDSMEIAPLIPEQDVTPWAQCLCRLLADNSEFDRVAAISRGKALEFVRTIDVGDFEAVFEHIARTGERGRLSKHDSTA